MPLPGMSGRGGHGLDHLLDGYARFRSMTWPAERLRYETLSLKGQRPRTLVVSCSDSRVDPATVFNTAPGEMFAIRNVAGLVPPYRPDGGCHGTSAALEFGVRVLKVSEIVVLGHAQCGGVQAMVQGAPPEAGDFVAPWMECAASVVREAPEDLGAAGLLAHCELAVVRLSLTNLMSFPWIAEAVGSGRLALHGMQFDIHTGVLARVTGSGAEPIR